MLATILQQDAPDAAARSALWRQIVDLLAQRRTDDDARLERDAYARLREWREGVDPTIRLTVAQSLMGRRLPAALVGFFADDIPPVAVPLLATAMLDSDEWIGLIPALSPVARAVLRHRDDLDPSIERALASFGAADFVLAAPRSPATSGETISPAVAGPPPIAELLRRIDTYRRDDRAAPPTAAASARVERFRFETGIDGLFRWIDGAPREALYGLGIAVAARGGEAHGIDAHAAGAFRTRAPFRDARLMVAGEGPASGDWRISGVPVFDPASGRFGGYRGSARRPRFDERAHDSPLLGPDLPGGAIHQLMHELRTPLTAVLGFAEMIGHGVLGAAPRATRDRAGAILRDAGRLLTAIDDLDVAARLDASVPGAVGGEVDAATRLGAIEPALAALALERGVRLELSTTVGLPPLAIDPASVDRMFGRLAGAVVGVADAGDVIAASLTGGDAWVHLDVDRGTRLVGREEAALLDPDLGDATDLPDAPVLGLGFSLRLVRRLAEAAGGALDIGEHRFRLRLPTADAGHRTTAEL